MRWAVGSSCRWKKINTTMCHSHSVATFQAPIATIFQCDIWSRNPPCRRCAQWAEHRPALSFKSWWDRGTIGLLARFPVRCSKRPCSSMTFVKSKADNRTNSWPECLRPTNAWRCIVHKQLSAAKGACILNISFSFQFACQSSKHRKQHQHFAALPLQST